MKIGYHLINSPFYLNDNLDYKPPKNNSIILFGTLIRATSRTPHEIKLSIPIDDGGKGGFNYTLEGNAFDNAVLTLKLLKLPPSQWDNWFTPI